MDPSSRPSLGFIGTGVVAATLSQAFDAAGYRVAAVHGRDRHRAETLAQALLRTQVAVTRQDVADTADVVFLTVPDDAIASVAASIAWRPGQAVVHCNGAASIELLRAATDAGADAGVFHPLQSFASVEQARRLLSGSAFRIEASSDRLQHTLEDMARELGGRPFALGADPTLYHVSAVLASNYLVTLLDLASGLWPEFGVGREEGLKALLPLVRGTIENVERLGIPAALTGPIARGDEGTVAHHLDTLGQVAPHIVPVYKELALHAVQVALAKGSIDRARAQRLEDVLAAAGTEKSEGGARCG
jgi:predicted short-subunit dehydrogenase-like oxidoreductase (DUF2520 family)